VVIDDAVCGCGDVRHRTQDRAVPRQQRNHARAGTLAAGREVLDAFSYTAAFACHALAGGARRVVCLESSPDAIVAARDNLALNGADARADVRAVNVFDELRRLERDRARFDLVILDPPAFARGRTTIEAAARGYKEINLRALRLLPPGGHLMTFSCSHHVSDAHFEAICRRRPPTAGVSVRVLEILEQADDHPVLLEVPETATEGTPARGPLRPRRPVAPHHAVSRPGRTATRDRAADRVGGLRLQTARRIVRRLVGEVEGAPVHAENRAAPTSRAICSASAGSVCDGFMMCGAGTRRWPRRPVEGPSRAPISVKYGA
jgi:hypothetical protein